MHEIMETSDLEKMEMYIQPFLCMRAIFALKVRWAEEATCCAFTPYQLQI
jgi:hypothetical protein